MKLPYKPALLTIAGSLFFNAAAYSGLSLTNGSATIDYDKTAWDGLASAFGPGPILTLNAYFDQAASNARTATQILNDPAPFTPSYTGEIYAMNGPSVTNLTGRTTKPTTFDFTLGNPQIETGSIGLAGVTRFAVAGGGSLLYGDYTLQYDATRISLGGSGWYLKGNIPPAAAAFDLLNVNVVETPDLLTISGDLGVSYEVANFLYGTPSDAGKDVGNFTFTASIVPEPSTAFFGFAGVLAAASRRSRNKKANVRSTEPLIG